MTTENLDNQTEVSETERTEESFYFASDTETIQLQTVKYGYWYHDDYVNARTENLRNRYENYQAQAIEQAKEELKNWFAQKVMEYPQGCQDGKRDFLSFCNIEFPMRQVRLTIDVSINKSHDVYTFQRAAVRGFQNEISQYDDESITVIDSGWEDIDY